MSNHQNTKPPSRKTLTFPYTDELIDVVSYYDLDGRVRYSEAMFTTLSEFGSFINKLGVTKSVEGVDRFIKVLSTDSVILYERYSRGRVDEGNNDQSASQQLSPNVIQEIRQKVVAIMNFDTYFTDVAESSVTAGRTTQLSTLLRLSAGARIKFLPELVGFYHSLNCQSYFDACFFMALNDTYTVGSILSVLGLYYQSYKSLRGKTMIESTKRLVSQDDYILDYNTYSTYSSTLKPVYCVRTFDRSSSDLRELCVKRIEYLNQLHWNQRD